MNTLTIFVILAASVVVLIVFDILMDNRRR